MSLTLDLPKELESELAAEANQFSLSLADYIVRLLATGRSTSPMPRTGAELIAYWQAEGVIGSRTDIKDSAEHARSLRRGAEKRSHE